MFGLFKRKPAPTRAEAVENLLSMPLLHWSNGEACTLRDAIAGTAIFGPTGSGKTSGSGYAITMPYLRAGFGGLVLTAKADERVLWERYCREAGRLDDLIIIGADAAQRFNFLDYELNRKGEGAGLTENIVSLFTNVMEIRERNSSGGGGGDESPFWKENANRTLRSAVDLVAFATGKVSVPELVSVCLSAPTSPAQLRDTAFQESSKCFQYLKMADRKPKTARQQHDFGVVCDLFGLEWPNLAERTRSTIQATFMGWADLLNRGLLRELFCTDTTITPDAVRDGKIILLDLPVKEYGEVGQLAQVIFKYSFQRSIERRNVSENPRPVFLWMDEAQHFLTSYDFQFQATCRSAWVATVMLSQSISSFYAALGGNERARVETDSLLTNLTTKVFHALGGDAVTAEWAAGLIGRTRQFFANGNTTHSGDDRWSAVLGLDWLGHNGSTSAGFSESFEFEVQPREFTRLRTGGPANDWCVDAIVFQNGRVFKQSGRSWLPVTFRQKR